jgi:hypothetical protein
MTAPLPPPARRYTRPKRPFSLVGIMLGLIVGIGGAFAYTQFIDPVEEANVEPWQLNRDDQDAYLIALALAFASDGDLDAATSRLLALRLSGDPIAGMADTACRLATTGYADSTSGLNGLRALVGFYRLQGRTGCADALIGGVAGGPTPIGPITLPSPTPTLPPPPTKTPTPDAALPTRTPIVPTVDASGGAVVNQFELLGVTTFCDPDEAGLIQVMTYALNGSTGIPGVAVRARWQGGESRFFTGLKPELGAGYSDFAMTEGVSYLIDLPGTADPVPEPLVAVACTTETGGRSLIGYQVIYRAIDG